MVNYKKQSARLINWLFVALLVLLWLQFFFNVTDQEFSNSGISVAANSSNSTTVPNQSIAKYHIFGSAEKLYEVPLAQGLTSVKLILNGTMSHVDGQSGLAYISNSNGVQQKFKVGDKIFNLATLKEIYKDFVVISNNGKNEKLMLPETSTSTQRKRIINKKINDKNRQVFAKHLNGAQLLQQQKFDANTIGDIVKNLKPMSNNMGEIKAIRVAGLSNSGLLTKLGFKPDDEIIAIGGNRITNKSLMNLQKTFESKSDVDVTFKRNGKVQNLRVNLNKFK